MTIMTIRDLSIWIRIEAGLVVQNNSIAAQNFGLYSPFIQWRSLSNYVMSRVILPQWINRYPHISTINLHEWIISTGFEVLDVFPTPTFSTERSGCAHHLAQTRPWPSGIWPFNSISAMFRHVSGNFAAGWWWIIGAYTCFYDFGI